eukprot:TRINITY_DN10990_c0_g1_i4.p1 TRINITY_DN10990_c0_g1~~TRINITY_DN10990_c0_g1_i4.p1  ORF type:complete len:739 (+),score=224.35 TRINITY_DN10990_c0_g1_i4:54-2219(+)
MRVEAPAPGCLADALHDAWAYSTAAPYDGEAAALVQSLCDWMGGNVRDVVWGELPEEVRAAVSREARRSPDVLFAALSFAAQLSSGGCSAKGPLHAPQPTVRLCPRTWPRSGAEAVCGANEGWVAGHKAARQRRRLLCVDGAAVRADRVRSSPAEAAWKCETCPRVLRTCREGGRIAPPVCCDGCGSHGLAPTPHGSWEEVQSVVLQSTSPASNRKSAPEVTVELRGALAGSVVPGQCARVLGVVRGRKEVRHDGALSLVCVLTASSGPPPPPPKRAQELRDLVAANRSAMLHIVCNSLAPDLVGHEAARAAAVLALAGAPSRANAGIRFVGRVGVLVVGDRSVGKSTLLAAAAAASPRGVLLDGRDAQQMQLLRPSVGRGGLRCGAVGAATDGLLCVDEVACCPEAAQDVLRHSLLHSSIPVLAEMPATVTCGGGLLASATPTKGIYRRDEPLGHNISRLSRRLVQCFDLVVPMLDHRDEGSDALLSALLLDMFSAGVDGAKERIRRDGAGCTMPVPTHATDTSLPLLERLRLPRSAGTEAAFDALPPRLLRQYLQLARQSIPVLGAAARRALLECCASLVSRGGLAAVGGDARRFAASLVRLSQARARIDLSDEVTVRHALDVVELVMECRLDLGTAAQKAAPKLGSVTKQAKELYGKLQGAAARDGKDTFSETELRSLCKRALKGCDVGAVLRRLNEEGLVIRTVSGAWQVVGGDVLM